MTFKDKLDAGQFVVTAEATPPLAAEPSALIEKAKPLQGLADAVNVTDGAGARVAMGALAAAAILLREEIEPILQITCRDRNRIALQAELLGAAALGIRNVLVLRGDDPKGGDHPDAKPVFDFSSTELIAAAAAIRDRGELLVGRKVEGAAPFVIGAADAPLDPPPGWEPKGLAAKVEAGAEFAQTQFCMDAGVVRRYVARLAEAGLGGRIKLLIGVAPLASARSARWIVENLRGSIIPEAIVARLDAASDPRAEGSAICVELLRELSEIPGVAGAHVMAPLNEKALPEVLAAYRA
jgi:methylenetetrahydrofolate reductase (NADPH)